MQMNLVKRLIVAIIIGVITGWLLARLLLLIPPPQKDEALPEQGQQTEIIATEVPEEETTVAEIVVPVAEPEPVYIGEFKLTAYCSCEKCCGVWATKRPKDENGNDIVYTSTGTVAKAGRTIAVDPSVIPYGTEVEINGRTYVAEDCGGAIKGNRIDVYFDDHNEALIFGVQYSDVYLCNVNVSVC